MEVVKRNELHTFVVLSKRWVVERSFAWLEKCRRLWKNCEESSIPACKWWCFAFMVLILKRLYTGSEEAWLEVSYSDGRKEVRRWDASRMSTSSNVIGNLRSRPEFRNGTWQENGIASLRVSVEHPRSKEA